MRRFALGLGIIGILVAGAGLTRLSGGFGESRGIPGNDPRLVLHESGGPSMGEALPDGSKQYTGRNYQAQVTGGGLDLMMEGTPVSLGALRIEQGASAALCLLGEPSNVGSGVCRIDRGPLAEEYVFEGERVEQLFRIPKPVGIGALTVYTRIEVGSGGRVLEVKAGNPAWKDTSLAQGGLCFLSASAGRGLAYYGAVAIDAAGHRTTLDPRFENGEVALRVPADFMATASFPVVVDPYIITTSSGTATLLSIAVTPSSPTISIGSNLAFTATGSFSDGSSHVLTSASTWTSKASFPTPAYPIWGGAAVVNGILYVVGGGYGTTQAYSPFTNALLAYDPLADSWSAKAPMPTSRQAHCVAVVDGILYAIGGLNSSFSNTGVVEAYDPATNSWTTKTSMPTARMWAGTAVVNGIIYVVGGEIYGPGTCLSVVEAYDPVSDSWSTKTSRPIAQKNAQVVALNNQVLAAGGSNNSGCTNEVDAYDPISDSWSLKAPMQHPRAVSSFGMINGKFYVLGGADPNMTLTAEVYDPAVDAWTLLDPIPTAHFGGGCAALNGSLYLVGGSDSIAYTAAVDAFTPGDGVVWSSGTPSVASLGSGGSAVGLSFGSSVITASLGGVDGATLLTVVAPSPAPPTLQSINVTPSSPTINPGASQQFTATGNFSDGTSRTLTGLSSGWSTGATFTGPLGYLRGAALNGNLYALGASASTPHLDAYDSVAHTWSAKAPMSTARQAPGVGTLGGLLYVVGGINGSLGILSSVEVYSTTTDSWAFVPSMSTPRLIPSVVGLNGQLYVIGGYNGGSLASVEAYDPVSNSWSPRQSLPFSLQSSNARAIGGKIYVAGGTSGSSIVSTLLVYDPLTDTWTQKSSMTLSHFDGACGVINGLLYVAGGGTGSSITPTVEVYDPATDTWSLRAPMPSAAYSPAADALGGRLLAAGGANSDLAVNWDLLQIFTPGDGLQWSSSLTSVASISSTGLATGNAAGSSLITATASIVSGLATLTVSSPLSFQSSNIWVGLNNSDDVGIKFDLRVEVYRTRSGNTVLIGSGDLASVSGGSSGFNNAKLSSIPITAAGSYDLQSGDQLSITVLVRNAAVGSGKNSGTARLWYNDTAADCSFGIVSSSGPATKHLIQGFSLSPAVGTGSRLYINVAAGAKGSPFKSFGNWSTTIP